MVVGFDVGMVMIVIIVICINIILFLLVMLDFYFFEVIFVYKFKMVEFGSSFFVMKRVGRLIILFFLGILFMIGLGDVCWCNCVFGLVYECWIV